MYARCAVTLPNPSFWWADGCILGDLGRPTCSRCSERGYTCTYSLIRRKPGPAARSYRGPGPSSSRTSSDHRRLSINAQSSHEDSSTPDSLSETRTFTPHNRRVPIQSESCQDPLTRSASIADWAISSQEERLLIETFFDTVHTAIPILSKERFLHQHRSLLVGQNLILAIITITAKLTEYTFSTEGFDTDAQINSLLSAETLEGDMLGQTPSLDQFRVSCLLAFYEFHQFPGHRAWTRIGDLTRMAYRVGLDRIETLRARYLDWGSANEADIQEWRLVWWCVYRLDSYSNISSGTPYLVEQETICTALIRDNLNAVPDFPGSSDQLCLPSQPSDLWKILPSLVSNPETSLYNIHIVTIAALRQAGTATRLRFLQSPEKTIASLSNLERSLSALRLALPSNHLNPNRNAFLNETGSAHHERLVTVLHLLMARLLTSILMCFRPGEDGWLTGWQQALESCQNIASIAEQWNGSFSVQVDPAIAFVLFTALIFLHIHKRLGMGPSTAAQSSIEHCETILLLQLEQFGRIWTLPRLLILSLKSFRESVSGPLSQSQVQLVLSRFEAPLHPRWLHFLSSARIDLELFRSVPA
ncbi:hypothetical protein CC78DRAFT_574715 [Lojkania enalia]|uniref:Xylanolytic transcriptional activator regulatory domain-containing protein n=1 Tax=Lojkania enalia TaxID=147567 RepID=A0A9P4TP45_9PLEO|nr:hypothetical protein CC78DRAFT_574715 [Didymosphaeria enalia]